jgi:hypothetical protein
MSTIEIGDIPYHFAVVGGGATEPGSPRFGPLSLRAIWRCRPTTRLAWSSILQSRCSWPKAHAEVSD